MLKKIILIVAAVLAFANFAFAVEVNSADRAALDGIKSIGPKTADAIIAERTKSGKFKDWNDLIHRVKGVGPKNAQKMSGAGLTVDGAPLANAPAVSEPKKKAPSASKEVQPAAPAAAATADTKSVKADAKPAAPAADDKKKMKQ